MSRWPVEDLLLLLQALNLLPRLFDALAKAEFLAFLRIQQQPGEPRFTLQHAA